MKKVIFALACVALFTVLCANPVIPRAVARVWFDANEDFNVLFGDENANSYDIPSMSFSTSSGTWSFPANFTPPSDPPYSVNFTQTIPGFDIQRRQFRCLAPNSSRSAGTVSNVLTPAISDRVLVKYTGTALTNRSITIKLFDLRGRVLSQYELPASGQMDLILPRLGSGVYFLSAFSADRMLSRQKLTVIK
ncbi:MAG: T9SS type A sorting domain-containing protein [Candidatus Cloacimonadaceae bacterium]|nr:T9SS type A sorting domain-containing protein [Candidatus Cloacimonadaceae bacterium]